jgi:hypothetical protein
VHDVGENQKFSINKEGSGTPFSNPRIVSGILHDRSWTTFSDGTLETFTKLLLLDFFEASIYLQPVDYYEGLIYANLGEKEGLKVSLAKNPHLQVPLGLFEPRLSAKSRDAFKEIEDAEGILRSVNNLVDSIKCVITALESVDRHEMQSAPNKDYDERMEMLEGLCAERRKNAERALNALARQLDYLTKKHAISEAKAIRILTILASFYLPLSLSGTLLGMSTPFKRVAHNRALSDSDSDLIDTNLLFDFFGCFVVLATGTIIIVHIIRFILWLKAHGVDTLSRQLDILPRHLSGTFTLLNYGKLWRFGGRGGDFFQLVRVSSRWFVGLGLGITLLIIFMIGMLKNSEEAWFYARWVFAAYITTSGLLLILFLLLYIWLYCKSFKRGWMFRVLKAIHLV